MKMYENEVNKSRRLEDIQLDFPYTYARHFEEQRKRYALAQNACTALLSQRGKIQLEIVQ